MEVNHYMSGEDTLREGDETYLDKANRYRHIIGEKIDSTQQLFLRSVVSHPIRHCLIQWFILFVITIFVALQGYFDFIDFGVNDFVVSSEVDTQNFLAVSDAFELLDEELDSQDLTVATRGENLFDISFTFLYESSSGSLLTPENLQEMCEVESLVLGQERYKEYCPAILAAGVNSICQPEKFTVTNAYFKDGPCRLLSQIEIEEAEIEPQTIAFMFDNFQNPTVMRSLISLAGPLGADSRPNLDFDEVFESFDDEQVVDGYDLLWSDFIDDLFDFFGVQNTLLKPAFFTTNFQRNGKDLLVRTGGTYLDSTEFLNIIFVDQGLSGGSYLVVLVFMSVYMRSCFLACVSMIAILLSMAVGLFLFSGILQIVYFTPLSILVLFLIAGVGADNVFVLYDAWRQSEEEIKKEDLAKSEDKDKEKEVEEDISNLTEEERVKEVLFRRLYYAYTRASLSVSQTACTTFIAFLATASSPITVIAGLGLYASMVIISNLWYMYTVHPVNLMFYYYIFVLKRKYRLPVENEDMDEEEEEEEEEEIEETNLPKRPKSNSFSVDLEKQDDFFSQAKLYLSKISLEALIERYVTLINETIFPYVAVAVVFILVSVLLSSTVQLETPSTLESNFPEGHMLFDYTIDFNNLFSSGTEDSFTAVQGVFGIEGLDITANNRFSTSDLGDAVFDEDFEIFSKESQDFILRICDELPLLLCDEGGCQEETLLLQQTGVTCFLQNFQEFVATNTSFIESFVDDNVPGAIPSRNEFLFILGEFLDSTDGSRFNRLIGIIEEEIKFVILEYRMSMIKDQPLRIKRSVVALFDDYTEVVRARAMEEEVSGVDTFFQTSFDHVWQHTEAAFVSGLFSGLAISLVASFFVLLIGTKNPRVSFFAIIGVASVVISVLGTVQYMGFALGTAESVAGVFVIGLAVDYIVHLGHLFMHSREFLEPSPNPGPPKNIPEWWYKCFYQTGEEVYYNKDMLEFSVTKIGGTVVAGALTTFAAAAFLSLCTFAFFRKMSVLLMFTILYSVSYAFLYFIPMLKLLGPGTR